MKRRSFSFAYLQVGTVHRWVAPGHRRYGDSSLHRPYAGKILTTFVLTLLAVAGAAIGAWMTERWSSFERALPFSAGVLAGMALLLVLPEALRRSSPLPVLGLCVAGLVIFSGFESLVHAAKPSPHPGVVGLIPLIFAMSIHSALDGWNIAVGLRIGPANAVTAFIAGMALHKLLGGLMIGAVFRAGSRNRVQAALWAGATESFTLVGAIANQRLSGQLSEGWSAGLLSVTAGSFLYLGYHSLERARRTAGLWQSLSGAGLGLTAVWLLVLLE